MAREPYSASTPRGFGRGYLFGVPMGELGLFASILMGLTTGMAAFFAATFVGIVTILALNANGRRADYTWSYLRVGLPVGGTVMVLALAYLGTLWVRRKFLRH